MKRPLIDRIILDTLREARADLARVRAGIANGERGPEFDLVAAESRVKRCERMAGAIE